MTFMPNLNDPDVTGAQRLAPAAVPLAAIWLLALLMGGSAFDRDIIISAHVGEAPLLLPVLLVTRLGDWEVLLAIPFFAVAWLLFKRKRRLALFLLAAIVSGRLLVALQKYVFARVRPEEHEYLVRVETYAFPSGHAANSMIVYLLLAMVLVEGHERRRVALAGAFLLSLLIGSSRVFLGVHWPTDVLGGWAFGLLWVLLAIRSRRRLGLNPS